MFKLYFDLTKFGIVVFVLLSGIAGYVMSFPVESHLNWQHFGYTLLGLYFLSSGSLALNQVQEVEIDKKMVRTQNRPVASGKIKPLAAAILAASFIFTGNYYLFQTSETAGLLGLVTIFLYNGLYTMWWKKKWNFAAIPGAIPGALPVTIGYAANESQIFLSDSVYLFLVMFLWQMPHFWLLAVKFKDQYANAGIPTLPVSHGVEKTIYHIGIWTFAYAAIALISPWFVQASWLYLFIVLPLVAKLLIEYKKYYQSKGEKNWFAFFMWTNFAMLAFLFIPIVDKWGFLIFPRTI